MENSLFKHNLKYLTQNLYDLCDFTVSAEVPETETNEYGAGTYTVNNLKVITRTAKVTPKKIGQFVAIWQRDENGITQPQHIEGNFDLMVINCQTATNFGQFTFPKSALTKHNIISTPTKRGKNGIRVYPPWDEAINQQAVKTQAWQLQYFLHISPTTNSDRAKKFYTQQGK